MLDRLSENRERVWKFPYRLGFFDGVTSRCAWKEWSGDLRIETLESGSGKSGPVLARKGSKELCWVFM